jgi:hypothetical protein
MAVNTTWRALYGVPPAVVALSALARLLATTLSRCDCADSAELAISKTFSKDISGARRKHRHLLPLYRREEAADTVAHESEIGLHA